MLSPSNPKASGDAEEAARILLRAGVVEVTTAKPFRYASGLLSPIYTNCRRLVSHPRELREIIAKLVESGSLDKTRFDVIAAAGPSSIVLATYLSERKGLPMIFIRPNQKSHGKMRQVEGLLQPGASVLLVSDIMSTEEDIPHSLDAIRAEGGRVSGFVTLFDNKVGLIEPQLQKEGVSFSALCDIVTLLRVARSTGQISDDQARAAEEWVADPIGWSRSREQAGEWTISDSRAIADALLGIDAVAINADHPFRFTSGLLSPIYTDNRLLISHPREWKIVVDGYETLIRSRIGLANIDTLAGTAISGIPHATRIAERLGLPMVYVDLNRRAPQGSEVIEGILKPGDRVVIVEDHVTTGASVARTADVLRRHDAKVDWCVAIFTYDTTRSKLALKKEGIGLETLCDLPVLLDVATESGRIGRNDKATVLEWVENPEFWAAQRRKAPAS